MEKLPNVKIDWEGAACGLYQETYPLYPKEPLLLLIKTGMFLEQEGKEYSAEWCRFKLALFVLLASRSDFK